MRILFYMPAITPWWFDHVITPMLATLNGEPGVGEIHVMTAPLWRNTGLEGRHLAAVQGLTKLHWYIVDGDDPGLFRRDGSAIAGLMDTVERIAPDLTLARSADFVTPTQFPGRVRHIMEGAALPFLTDPAWVVLDDAPFRHGHRPADTDALAQDCAALIAPAWDALAARQPSRAEARQRLGLPGDRPIIAVPLLHEHEDNLYLTHASHPTGQALLADLLERGDPDALLAISDHPLNRLHGDRRALHDIIQAHGDRMRLIDHAQATPLLAVAADAMVADLDKSWSLSAFAGTPLLNARARPLAPWLNAHPLDATLHPALTAPDATEARRWFGWHLCTRMLRPATATMSQILHLAADRPSPADIADNVTTLARMAREIA